MQLFDITNRSSRNSGPAANNSPSSSTWAPSSSRLTGLLLAFVLFAGTASASASASANAEAANAAADASQMLRGLPDCAQPCRREMWRLTRCGENDYACLCGNEARHAAKESMKACITQNCDLLDSMTTSKVAKKACERVAQQQKQNHG